MLTITAESKHFASNDRMTLSFPSIADFQNQPAYQLAKKHDPDGLRTIGERHFSLTRFISDPSAGVLTKPDRIGAGAPGIVVELMED